MWLVAPICQCVGVSVCAVIKVTSPLAGTSGLSTHVVDTVLVHFNRQDAVPEETR